ncbi:hypothetical protein [Acinetobacter gyllenbergii]|uniref:hypothetical protein n=1 Tax=Acinetobacter gyllenbergii TaxID=134534 RepID=UPI003F54BA25
MNYATLIKLFRNNQTDPGLLIDRLTHSSNPLHHRDIPACTEMLNKALMVFHEMSENKKISPLDFIDQSHYSLENHVFLKQKNENNIEKTIIYVFNYIPPNSLTQEFTQCLGTLNSPNVFGNNSSLNLQGVLLNIFEIVNASFIFPVWCNVFYINGQKNRAIPNIALNSIEPQLSNPIDFFPDAIETLNQFYAIELSRVELSIDDVFLKS